MAVKVRLNIRGINALMSSARVQAELDDVGESMASEAGAGFEYVPSPHRWTARGFVQVDSADGARRQADEAVLERVVSG
jgi:hypothetical protein